MEKIDHGYSRSVMAKDHGYSRSVMTKDHQQPIRHVSFFRLHWHPHRLHPNQVEATWPAPAQYYIRNAVASARAAFPGVRRLYEWKTQSGLPYPGCAMRGRRPRSNRGRPEPGGGHGVFTTTGPGGEPQCGEESAVPCLSQPAERREKFIRIKLRPLRTLMR